MIGSWVIGNVGDKIFVSGVTATPYAVVYG
jgi:hypothetical protein